MCTNVCSQSHIKEINNDLVHIETVYCVQIARHRRQNAIYSKNKFKKLICGKAIIHPYYTEYLPHF